MQISVTPMSDFNVALNKCNKVEGLYHIFLCNDCLWQLVYSSHPTYLAMITPAYRSATSVLLWHYKSNAEMEDLCRNFHMKVTI